MRIETLMTSCFVLCLGLGVHATPNWEVSDWISASDAPVADEVIKKSQRAADGTAVFAYRQENTDDVVSAIWTVTGLGVFDCAINGKPVGDEVLKPGFTHILKTRRSFTWDVTEFLKRKKGETNLLSAEVSAGWWRDKIVNYFGQKSALRAVLEVTYAGGKKVLYGTKAGQWRAQTGGSVLHAAIFDGEEIDARRTCPATRYEAMPLAVRNDEFKGEILPSAGGEVYLRRDLTLYPCETYCWKGIVGADVAKKVFGRVIKTRVFDNPKGTLTLEPGETLVADFAQNAAAVPELVLDAEVGTVVTVLPGEMLNDANGERSRGNDGPAGSVYRENLRTPKVGMRLVYTCKGGGETCLPRFTFFGYRYMSITASARVVIRRLASIPVTSISKQMETGRIETGDPAVNKLISNVLWGQRSNYLSVPTDCPQRNERLGWTADTQVFCEAGTYNANTARFFHKWMRDLCDTQNEKGGFTGVAPRAQYGSAEGMRVGWSDAGIIVPWTMWLQFGDTSILTENWAAMEKYMARTAETKYRTENAPEAGNGQWADWLSLTKLESCPYKPEYSAYEMVTNAQGRVVRRPKALTYDWWGYLGGSYWIWNAERMCVLSKALGKDAGLYEKMAADARAYMKQTYFATADGMVIKPFADMQTAHLFALKLNLVSGVAKEKTKQTLRSSIAQNGGTLHTGFLGTSIALDVLTENGMVDLAYNLLLNHKFPGWLYSVDQGATTIWERWNSYVKETGFGPVSMNSFNHYAYGSVLAWIYHTAAGIKADPAAPGFKHIILAPKTDRRLGHLTAQYKSVSGLIKSAWQYDATGRLTWKFTIPEGACASVTYPWGGTQEYGPGSYEVTGK